MNAAARWFAVSTVELADVVIATALLTVRLKLAVVVAPLLSVTVTAYAVRVLVAVGVPLMDPATDMLRPVGRAGNTL